jgi:hypothetical protein
MNHHNGYLPHAAVKGGVFWILTICLAVATLSGILRSWEVIDEVTAGRSFWTVFFLALGSVAFLLINYVFGDGVGLFSPATPPPSTDPAFSKRLRKAKADSQPGDRSEDPLNR